jgi:hypothetical protein
LDGKWCTASEPQETKKKTMSETVPNSDDLRTSLQSVLAQVSALAERVAGLEKRLAPAGSAAAPVAAVAVAKTEAPAAQSPVAKEAGISEEEFLAISAAIATWFGVHAHVRQIRLIRTGAWAQQGRVSIQTSHTLYN